MKRPTVLLCVSVGFFLVGAVFFLSSFRLQRDNAAASTSIAKLDLAIHRANRIEMLVLAPSPTENARQTFTTAGYKETYFVTSTRDLDPESVSELKKLLQDHYYTTQFSAACHNPGYALRFYNDSALLLETSLCLECTNLQFFVYPFIPASVSLGERHNSTLDLPRLAAFFEAVVKA